MALKVKAKIQETKMLVRDRDFSWTITSHGHFFFKLDEF